MSTVSQKNDDNSKTKDEKCCKSYFCCHCCKIRFCCRWICCTEDYEDPDKNRKYQILKVIIMNLEKAGVKQTVLNESLKKTKEESKKNNSDEIVEAFTKMIANLGEITILSDITDIKNYLGTIMVNEEYNHDKFYNNLYEKLQVLDDDFKYFEGNKKTECIETLFNKKNAIKSIIENNPGTFEEFLTEVNKYNQKVDNKTAPLPKIDVEDKDIKLLLYIAKKSVEKGKRKEKETKETKEKIYSFGKDETGKESERVDLDKTYLEESSVNYSMYKIDLKAAYQILIMEPLYQVPLLPHIC